MNTNKIDGQSYKEMLSCGTTVLNQHIGELNSLNVFPVADGDTGTNMFATIEGGVAALNVNDNYLGNISAQFSRAALLSARGNSGVILSQIFAGINRHFEKLDSASAADFAEAISRVLKALIPRCKTPPRALFLPYSARVPNTRRQI